MALTFILKTRQSPVSGKRRMPSGIELLWICPHTIETPSITCTFTYLPIYIFTYRMPHEKHRLPSSREKLLQFEHACYYLCVMSVFCLRLHRETHPTDEHTDGRPSRNRPVHRMIKIPLIGKVYIEDVLFRHNTGLGWLCCRDMIPRVVLQQLHLTVSCSGGGADCSHPTQGCG